MGCCLHIKGQGYELNYFEVAPVTRSGATNIIIGWQLGAVWAKLSVYEWTENGLREVTDHDYSYSKLDILDMNQDGKVELALWQHDTGEAYMLMYMNGRMVNCQLYHLCIHFFFQKL